VRLIDFVAPPRSSSGKPYARLNYLFHAKDRTGDLYVNDTRGLMWRIDGDTRRVNLFLNLRKVRGGAFLATGGEMGFRSFAFHPNFARPGRIGYRKLYTMSTETRQSRPDGVDLFTGPYPVQHHNVLAEWQVERNDRTVVDPGSRREVLRIAQMYEYHNTDQILFNITRQPGHPDYGRLYIGTGDGGAGGDPYNVAQDPRRLLGKVLRIIPAYNRRGERYRIPPDNPFVGRDGYLPHIWAMGLRHPQNLSIDVGGTRELVFTDIGARHIEEVNILRKGANYGWPRREGTFVTDRANLSVLYRRGPNDARRAFTYPVAQYDHDDGRAITGGFVCRSAGIPALEGHYLSGDIVNGRIFHVPFRELLAARANGTRATLRELTLIYRGQRRTMLDIVNAGRVDLRFGQGQDGTIYVMSKQDGWIRRLAAA
jgi:glucose/arabinose dehydrogenase